MQTATKKIKNQSVDADLNNQENLLRSAIQNEIDKYNISQATVAKEANVSTGFLSAWMKSKYRGNANSAMNAMKKWLDYRMQKKIIKNELPKPPDFITTHTAARIINALGYAQMSADIAIIYGGAGLGKTQSIRHYAHHTPSVWVIEATPTNGTVGGFLRSLASEAGIRIPRGYVDALELMIREKLTNTGGLIVIDEAQFLNNRALETARRLTELAGIGLALAGNENVYAQLTGRSRAAEFAQLFSRIGKRVRLTQPTAQDIKAIASGWKITTRSEIDYLFSIAKRAGGIRLITKVLRIASMLKTDDTIVIDNIKTAYADLSVNV